MRKVLLICIFCLPVCIVADSVATGNTNYNVSNLKAFTQTLKLKTVGEARSTQPMLSVDVKDYTSPWTVLDTDQNQSLDYFILKDKNNVILAELYDYNADGLVDDFNYYLDGLVIFREIDSNYDGKIDLWLYIHKGNYLKAYEKDKDFDGLVDVVKKY